MSATASPRGELTRAQKLKALAQANEIRLARAALKAKIASGEIFAASVLLDVPREAQSWPVADLLRAQHRWETKRAHRLLARYHIADLKPVGKLTERQRKLLAEALEVKA